MLAALAVIGPNSNHIGARLRTLCQHRAAVRWLLGGVGCVAVAFILTINIMRDSVSAFIYFNF